MNYRDAIELFENRLFFNNMDVSCMADYYHKELGTCTKSDLIKKLRCRYVVKRYQDDTIKSISINFTDTKSGINVKEEIKPQ